MKRKIKILFSCFFVLLLICGCNTSNNSNDSIHDSDSELIIEYVSSDNMNYANFAEVEALYNFCDYVVVASPQESYTDSNQVWKNSANKDTNEVSDVDLAYSYTERVHKVNKVYKGDNKKIKEIIVCEEAYSDGDTIYVREGDYIAKKGNKYLLFLKESNVEEGRYFPCYFQGKYSLDTTENENNKQIDQSMFKLVKEMYKSDFTK